MCVFDLVTLAEAATEIGCGEELLKSAVRRGELRAYRLGGRGAYHVSERDLRRWLEGCATAPAPEDADRSVAI